MPVICQTIRALNVDKRRRSSLIHLSCLSAWGRPALSSVGACYYSRGSLVYASLAAPHCSHAQALSLSSSARQWECLQRRQIYGSESSTVLKDDRPCIKC
ncbi:hypothetical protein LshimejAT787_0309910 [Lyophyllum shimeji]|uniref:Uncharacterized protein n=1 Tax=Lyophyllum shimeji TaxID=47721 RepID=A0A9P3PJQ0_LYOSH|nr:hypothetical protein LshimejAT787_0309910 [Lyophyllum shimeji]